MRTHALHHVLSHHIGAASRALSSWHEFGLTLPPNTVAPQGLADILEQHKREKHGNLNLLLAPDSRNWIITILLTIAVNKACSGEK